MKKAKNPSDDLPSIKTGAELADVIMRGANRQEVLELQRELSIHFDGRSFATNTMTLVFLFSALTQSLGNQKIEDLTLDAFRILVKAVITTNPPPTRQ